MQTYAVSSMFCQEPPISRSGGSEPDIAGPCPYTPVIHSSMGMMAAIMACPINSEFVYDGETCGRGPSTTTTKLPGYHKIGQLSNSQA